MQIGLLTLEKLFIYSYVVTIFFSFFYSLLEYHDVLTVNTRCQVNVTVDSFFQDHWWFVKVDLFFEYM